MSLIDASQYGGAGKRYQRTLALWSKRTQHERWFIRIEPAPISHLFVRRSLPHVAVVPGGVISVPPEISWQSVDGVPLAKVFTPDDY